MFIVYLVAPTAITGPFSIRLTGRFYHRAKRYNCDTRYFGTHLPSECCWMVPGTINPSE